MRSLYFENFFPSWFQQITAWIIILLSTISIIIPTFQSGLLFTKIDVSCTESQNYCNCSTPLYSHPFWAGNIISEFELICENESKIGLSDICYFSGKLASGFAGFFLDNFSRKWTWVTMQVFLIVFTSLQTTAETVQVYSIYRFVQGFVCQLAYQDRDTKNQPPGA